MSNTVASSTTTIAVGGGSPEQIGNSGGLVGAFGTTPTSQATFVATMTITGLSVSGVIGFASSAQFSAALTLLNAVQQVLVNLGFMKSS
ncbi:MAG TPA: hypothetical protein VF516_03245 [Kofleriaceae bacterium]